ncbi:MAG: hypothetical protein Q9203_002419 [Teloschistes exilis]
MDALRAQGKFHYNADHRISLGTTDRPGPEVRGQRGQTFVQAIEAATSQNTTPNLVRTSALRLGAAASPKDIDDDTDEEDDEADEPRDAATVNTVRPTWPPSAKKDALQDRANAESNLPGMKILRPGHYAQKISKEPTAPKVRFQDNGAMIIDDQDAVTVAIPKKKKEDYKSASQPLRRRKLDTLPDTVTISPDMRRRFYRREDQPPAQGAVSVNTAAVDKGVRCSSTRTLDQPADLELYAAGCPEVKATVNDTPLMAMIDSGSEINVISGANARRAGLAWRTGPTLQLLGVNGKLTKFLGVCNGVEIDVGGAKRRMPIFVVDECDYDMILGRVYERKTRLCAQNHDDGTCNITVLGENDDIFTHDFDKELFTERLSRRFDMRALQYAVVRKVRVSTMYKRKAQKVRPVNAAIQDGSTPGGLADWKAGVLKAMPADYRDPTCARYDHWLVPKFTPIARGARLTPERLERIVCGDGLTLVER